MESVGAAGRGLTGRNMRVRVKTARGRKSSSTRWLDRQLNDPYVHEARKQGIGPAPLLSYCSWMTGSGFSRVASV